MIVTLLFVLFQGLLVIHEQIQIRRINGYLHAGSHSISAEIGATRCRRSDIIIQVHDFSILRVRYLVFKPILLVE